FKGSTFVLDVVAVLSNQATEDAAHGTIVVNITEDNFSLPNCSLREELCFSSPEIIYQVPEIVPEGSVLGNLKPLPYSKLCPQVEVKYRLPVDVAVFEGLIPNAVKTITLLITEPRVGGSFSDRLPKTSIKKTRRVSLGSKDWKLEWELRYPLSLRSNNLVRLVAINNPLENGEHLSHELLN
ncbi:uncharacterized protein NPIL_609431, partial [Nephila pilipes]